MHLILPNQVFGTIKTLKNLLDKNSILGALIGVKLKELCALLSGQLTSGKLYKYMLKYEPENSSEMDY